MEPQAANQQKIQNGKLGTKVVLNSEDVAGPNSGSGVSCNFQMFDSAEVKPTLNLKP